jgi:SNF2 family DNA or RNA helicase
MDVEHSLPPKTETKLFIGMTEMQRVWYQSVSRRIVWHFSSPFLKPHLPGDLMHTYCIHIVDDKQGL